MIYPDEKREIINTLGKNYLTQIIDFLTLNKLVKSSGEPYSKPYISQILSGSRENTHIESLILKCAYDALDQKEIRQKKRAEFVQRAKDVA